METILAYLVSGWDIIDRIATWSILHPLASAFWGAFLLAILDRIVKLTPWKADDSALDIIESAIRQAISRLPVRPGKPQ